MASRNRSPVSHAQRESLHSWTELSQEGFEFGHNEISWPLDSTQSSNDALDHFAQLEEAYDREEEENYNENEDGRENIEDQECESDAGIFHNQLEPTDEELALSDWKCEIENLIDKMTDRNKGREYRYWILAMGMEGRLYYFREAGRRIALCLSGYHDGVVRRIDAAPGSHFQQGMAAEARGFWNDLCQYSLKVVRLWKRHEDLEDLYHHDWTNVLIRSKIEDQELALNLPHILVPNAEQRARNRLLALTHSPFYLELERMEEARLRDLDC